MRAPYHRSVTPGRVRITFPKVSRRFSKACKCAGCGRPIRRQRTFYQTLSPFNTHALTKQPKDHAQIWKELDEEGAAWIAAPERCAKCNESATRVTEEAGLYPAGSP